MTRVLSPVLCSSDLPVAELHAARLDGELLPIDECFVPADAVDSPALRGAAMLTLTGPRAIAVLESALWVHGVLRQPPAVHQVRVQRHSRARLPQTRRLAVGTWQIPAEDLCSVGGMAVTTMSRTIVDLLFAEHVGRARRAVLRAVLGADPARAERCAERVRAATHLPGKRRALCRLAELAGSQPALTRYTS